jgi:hypothetical protein
VAVWLVSAEHITAMAIGSSRRSTENHQDYSRRQPELIVPIPDPSTVTAAEIARVRAELRDEFVASLASYREISTAYTTSTREIIEQRISGMDKTHTLLQDELKFQAQRLEVLLGEKLSAVAIRIEGMATQIRERDIRSEQDKMTASTAVSAALTANKELAAAMASAGSEAIAKSEAAVSKQTESLQNLIGSTKDGTNTQISNLTGRLDRGEGGSTGAKESVRERQAGVGMIVGVVGSVLGTLGFIAALSIGVVNLVKPINATPDATPISAITKLDDLLRSMQQRDIVLDQRVQSLERGVK